MKNTVKFYDFTEHAQRDSTLAVLEAINKKLDIFIALAMREVGSDE